MLDNNSLADRSDNISNQQPKKINIRMKPVDSSFQPVFSNVTSVSGNKEIVMLDFGYLDVQLIASLNRMLASGEKFPNNIDAKMTCRIALNFDAVGQLVKQLNHILEPQRVTKSEESEVEPAASVSEKESELSAGFIEQLDQDPAKLFHSGFKFPWSK